MKKTNQTAQTTLQTKAENDKALAAAIAETGAPKKAVSSQLEKPAKAEKVKKVKAEVMPMQTSLVPQKTKAESALEALELSKATESIKMEIANVANSFCKIGFQLWQVKEKRWFESAGFKNISEYGEHHLGFKKSSTANYIAICERFSIHGADGKPTAMLSDRFHLFSYTQLSEMLSLPSEKVEELTPDMTVKDIRASKKAVAADSPAEPAEPAELVDNGGSVDIFDRLLTAENVELAVRLLRESIGKEVIITVY